ncbi:hypothetical protein JOC54_004330 [Alkalihalobacillus xiaoxiensis]|uniref:Uncharacterized protein n=1 Tax=Shouchella xiaoxiensis TaxID=766895 RepID=A0ABS2T199_9BACI|nr:hypothetical protein [Shouchella xiaoxiensis]MBM7841031.1 hypothetical protein [Shouchella xiaoxiensis]
MSCFDEKDKGRGKEKDYDSCDCNCNFKRCFFPFPISRGDGCQPLATVGLTVLSLPANTAVTITANGLTYTGTFIGFDVSTGTVVFTDGIQTLRFSTSQICTITAI